jgi:hypothetical protein
MLYRNGVSGFIGWLDAVSQVASPNREAPQNKGDAYQQKQTHRK